MKFSKFLLSLIPPLLVPKAWWSPYEGANFSNRRARIPGVPPGDAKRDLSPWVRTELVRRSRYLYKNSGFVRELVSNMAIYSTGDGIKPQAQTADADWNRKAEEYFANWSARCEITRRFSFEECQALICRSMDIDGEFFVHKTRGRDGRPVLQLIESHRIGDSIVRDVANPLNGRDGIMTDEFGAPISYRVREDSTFLGYDDGSSRELPAAAVLHIYEPESASAIRNAPSIQHSINHIIDEMELLALEKHAVKDNADISRVLKTERGTLTDDSDFALGMDTGSSNPDPTDPVALQRIIGGKVVALKPNELIESYESKRPSPTFTGFLTHLRRDSALGVLPYEFAADSSAIGGASVRLVVAKADRRFSYRQLILIQRLIRPVWAYVIADAIVRKELPPMVGWQKIACTTPRRVTVDAGREAQQNRSDVETGLKTLSDHFAELGMDFIDEIDRRGRDAKTIMETAKKYGVPIEMLWRPEGSSQSVMPPDETDEDPVYQVKPPSPVKQPRQQRQ